MKIVFMGTPDFAAASLKALLDWDGGEVAAVYCQPDRPAGRGQSVKTGPVKRLALERGLPVEQPLNFRDEAALKTLQAYGADVFAVAAYGLILPQKVLDIPNYGAINVHGSLLPEYRGAAPIQRAVMNGDFRTGITIMRMELKLDSGPILLQRAMGIGIDQTAGEVHDELAVLGGTLLVETLTRLAEGRVTPVAQDDSRATYAAKLEKSDGVLDFTRSAREVHCQARGVTPWPGAQITIVRLDADGNVIDEKQAIVEKGAVLSDDAESSLPPGTLLELDGEALPVACSKGLYGIVRLKPAGKKSMSARDFANGHLKGRKALIKN